MSQSYLRPARLLLYAFVYLSAASAQAGPDYAREQRWADEVVPGLLVGEPIYLKQPNQHAFLAILAEAPATKMGVIVVHGMGLHPDWGMIGVLRQRLYDFGYTTLSIQMPVLDAEASFTDYPALFPDAAERLQIAVNYLKQRGYAQVAIVSHSNGSRMSRVFMVKQPRGVTAWAALSLTQGDTFAGVTVPVLDLYGERDLPHVLSSVTARKTSFHDSNKSQQIMLADADHFFNGHEEQMVQTVKHFLDQLRAQ